MSEATPSSWPGARDPSDQDVPSDQDLPDQAFLRAFRASLLAHEDSRGCIPLFHAHTLALDSRGLLRDLPYTYPLGALARFPDLPNHADLQEARGAFASTLHKHVFLNKVPVRSGKSSGLPPDLLLACACNGNALITDPQHDPLALFHAARQLCHFMVETDNRRSRSLDTVIAVSGGSFRPQCGA